MFGDIYITWGISRNPQTQKEATKNWCLYQFLTFLILLYKNNPLGDLEFNVYSLNILFLIIEAYLFLMALPSSPLLPPCSLLALESESDRLRCPPWLFSLSSSPASRTPAATCSVSWAMLMVVSGTVPEWRRVRRCCPWWLERLSPIRSVEPSL